MNTLFYGDNLDILRHYVEDESVDLVYLDPPFNSNRSYNVLFQEMNGVTESAAQIAAFEDTWRWDSHTEATFHEIAQTCPPNLVDMMKGLVQFLGRNEMTAYLVMMAIRLVELHRVLKPTGTLFLHCDPTAGHYLKILLDEIFGKDKMINQITWKRTGAHSDYTQGAKHMGRISDLIFWYAKGEDWTYNVQFTDYDQEYIDNAYRNTEEDTGRRFRIGDLTAAKPGGDTEYEWRVKRKLPGGDWQADIEDEYLNPQAGYEYKGVPPYKGRYWAYSRENMIKYEREGRIYYASTGMPNYRRYLDEMPGVPLQDLWTDISPVGSGSKERLGYPTQKPVALLERIIKMASNPGDVVLDPFCGCGTTIAAAESLGRTWIGIDLTHLAVNLIRTRLKDMYPECAFEVIGEPQDEKGARELAGQNRHQFEYWALSLVDARPATGQRKRGADSGVDGVLYVIDNPKEPPKKIVVQVKSGKVGVSLIRDFAHVIEREEAAMGLFVTLEPPTKPMETEAAGAGVYEPTLATRGSLAYPRLQILTISDLLEGQRPELPSVHVTYKASARAKPKAQQPSLFD